VLERIRDSRVVHTARSTGDRYAEDAGGYLAGAIAYFAFLSLFPLLLVALSVVGFVLAGDPALADDVSADVAGSVPGLESLIGDNLRAFERARAVTGLIGLAGLVWTGTGVAGACRNALRHVFREDRITSGVTLKAWLLGVTLGVGLLALVTTALSAVAAGWDTAGPVGILLRVLGAVVAVGLDLVLFLVAYRVLLRRRHRWRDLLPGAIFGAIGWTLLKLVGTWYATVTVERSETVYGAFAATVGVLVLLYLAGRVFVYGAELNAVLIEERGGGPMGTAGNGPAPGRGEGDPRELSTVQLVGRVAGDVGTLVRKEVELARQEVTEGITARIVGAAAFAGAAVMGLFLLGFLAAAGAAALALVLPTWAALLIVAGVFFLLTLAAALVGRARLKSPSIAPERAKENIREDVEWAKAQLRR
jgi:YihY family inner membrane protein